MKAKIRTHLMGKLRIYLPNTEQVKSKTLLRKMFPKNAYRQIVTEAKADGIMNASVFPTHFGYNNGGKIKAETTETGSAGLTICIELIDERPKLEAFFLTHKDALKGKVIIYKEVEFWDVE